MARRIVGLILIALLSVAAENSWAGSNAEHGLMGGAIGGVLIGQAIGRDTEATLVGTALGGMLGYIAGNEQDKVRKVRHRRVRERPRHRVPEPVCREAEVPAYVGGRPEQVWTTVCLENGEWVIAEDRVGWERTSIRDRRHRPPRWERHRYSPRHWRNDCRHRGGHRRDCHSPRRPRHPRPWGGLRLAISAPIF